MAEYIRVSEELHSRLKIYAANVREAMQSLAERYILAGIEGGIDARDKVLTGLSAPQRKLVIAYADLLRSGSEPKLMEAVKGIITFAAESQRE